MKKSFLLLIGFSTSILLAQIIQESDTLNMDRLLETRATSTDCANNYNAWQNDCSSNLTYNSGFEFTVPDPVQGGFGKVYQSCAWVNYTTQEGFPYSALHQGTPDLYMPDDGVYSSGTTGGEGVSIFWFRLMIMGFKMIIPHN